MKVYSKLVMTCLIGLSVMAGAMVSGGATASAQDREITQLTDNLYRFRNNAHVGVFLVSEAGILVADSIDKEVAEWLKGELASRFDVPVTYLVYSHHHGDHASGGEVFADTAEIIAHRNTASHMEGVVPADAMPDTVFDETAVIDVGGHMVELFYLTPSHSDSLIGVHFVDQGAVFAVDIVSVRRLPFRTFGDSYLPGLIEGLDRIAAKEPEILIPGHGPTGVLQDLLDYRGYVVLLREKVAKAIEAGMTVEEAVEAIDMSDYAEWSQYEAWGRENIEGMYRLLSDED